VPQAPVAASPIADAAQLEAIRELAERLRSTWEVVDRGGDFVWRGASASAWSATTEQRVRTTLRDALDALDALAEVVGVTSGDLLLDEPPGPAATERFVALAHLLEQRPEGVRSEWLHAIAPDELLATTERVALRVRQVADAGRRAAALAGPRWADLPPDADGAREVRAALADLEPVASARAEQLERLASATREVGAVAGELRMVGEELAVALGLRAVDLTLDDAERVGRLGTLAVAEHRPVTSWLITPSGLQAAQAAHDRLAPLVTAEREARKRAEAFEDAALELDLAALASRFHEQHRGLKKLGGAYRTDRDALARTAPGLTPKQAIETIDAAVAWQVAHRALSDAAEEQAAALGEAWDGPATDLRAVELRLGVAREVVELAGERVVDVRRFAEALGGDTSAPGLADGVARLEGAVGRVRSITPDALASLWALALDMAITRCRDVELALSRAADLTAGVDRVRGAAGSFIDAVGAHEAHAEFAAMTAQHAADTDGQAVLGPQWSRLEIDPDALSAAAEWAVEVRERVAGPVGRASAERLVTVRPAIAPLDGALSRWASARDLVLLVFDPERRPSVAEDLEGDFTDARALLARLDDTRGDIEIWLSYASAVQALTKTGLEPAVRFCVDRGVSAPQVVDVLRRSVFEATADALLAASAEALGPLRAGDRDRLVREYASADRRIVGDAAQRVMERANALRPSTVVGVAAIIRNEAEKKRRHMPVATLLSKTADVAQALKPCFMMSPLSVSQFLSPDMRFDVVIFDEASQVRPCDAVNALYRGDAMIVAGDQKQLPPTSFFDQSTDDGDDWSEEDLAEFGSVLDLAKGSGAFRSLSLRWHYRSRHESLIAFSNHRFYNGDLVTFPGPAERADGLGVELFQVDGSYRRGTSRDNPLEAQAVVDRIFFHAARGARSRSIGVVAFSEAQASLIEGALRQDERSREPRFEGLLDGGRLDGLFIKNLENVQGDERDIIIFSVGYGPDEHGKLTMGFGPINREGGWRRLNVAITRARMRVEVVCSFGAERLAGSGNKGVDALRRYLDFAARGPVALAVEDVEGDGGEPESPFEDSVLRTIRSWGYEVAAQVGTAGYRIDMAVRQPDRPGRFALGIECDGAMYHSSKVARDRDRLRQQVLEGLGWTLYRIWGPSWYRDRAGEERRLREAIERSMMDAPTTPQTAEPESLPIAITFEDLDLEAPPLWAEPYAVAQLYAPHAPDPAEMTANSEIRRLVLHATTEEGPIVEDLLVRRVIGAWHAMVTERRRQAVQSVIEQLVGAGSLVAHGNAYVLPHQRVDIVRVPADGDVRTEREVKHVPDVELAESLARLVEEARLVTDEEAVMRVARLFGWRRTGPAIQAALSRVVEGLIDDGRVKREGAYLRRGSEADRVSD
jgi:very-short-patch-repair endonuclease